MLTRPLEAAILHVMDSGCVWLIRNCGYLAIQDSYNLPAQQAAAVRQPVH